MKKFKKGKVVQIVNAEGLEEYGLKEGDTGEAVAMHEIGGQEVLFFRLTDKLEIYAINPDRVEEV